MLEPWERNLFRILFITYLSSCSLHLYIVEYSSSALFSINFIQGSIDIASPVLIRLLALLRVSIKNQVTLILE